MHRSIRRTLLLSTLVVAPASAETIFNDGWTEGDDAVFIGGFAVDDIGASVLTPNVPCPCQIYAIQLLFGGDTDQRNPTLMIWDDTGAVAPGELLLEERLTLTGSPDLQTIDLASRGLVVDGPFRVGLRFNGVAYPAIARDDDGDIQPDRNFVFLGSWSTAESVGISGDFVFGAVVDFAQWESARRDGWNPGDTAGFNAGFVAGERIAVRYELAGTCPCRLEAVRFLFGAEDDSRDVVLRVFEDNGADPVPGTPLFSEQYLIQSSPSLLRRIALATPLEVPSTFRVAIELTASGLPSVARDNDATIDEANNFMFLQGDGWVTAASMGISGDWILRADVRTSELLLDGFESGQTNGWSTAAP